MIGRKVGTCPTSSSGLRCSHTSSLGHSSPHGRTNKRRMWHYRWRTWRTYSVIGPPSPSFPTGPLDHGRSSLTCTWTVLGTGLSPSANWVTSKRPLLIFTFHLFFSLRTRKQGFFETRTRTMILQWSVEFNSPQTVPTPSTPCRKRLTDGPVQTLLGTLSFL